MTADTPEGRTHYIGDACVPELVGRWWHRENNYTAQNVHAACEARIASLEAVAQAARGWRRASMERQTAEAALYDALDARPEEPVDDR